MSKISKERKLTYYVGMGMAILGVILFISVFFYGISAMDDPFMAAKTPPFENAVIGMVLIIIGFAVMNIGARGAAGSGVILDPEKAREDLKPFNEATGGMINDVISNIDALDNVLKPNANKEIIKVKCRSCSSLNDEDARFCKGCGKEL